MKRVKLSSLVYSTTKICVTRSWLHHFLNTRNAVGRDIWFWVTPVDQGFSHYWITCVHVNTFFLGGWFCFCASLERSVLLHILPLGTSYILEWSSIILLFCFSFSVSVFTGSSGPGQWDVSGGVWVRAGEEELPSTHGQGWRAASDSFCEWVDGQS